MNWDTLNYELLTDPGPNDPKWPNPDGPRNYEQLNSQLAADDLNTWYRILKHGVFLSDVYQYLSHRNNNPGTVENAKWPCLVLLNELAKSGTIQGHTTTNPTGSNPHTIDSNDRVAAQNLCGFFEKATDAGGGTIYMDFSQAAMAASWDQMVVVGVISQTQRDAIPDLSDVPATRAMELRLPTVQAWQVDRVRSGAAVSVRGR